MDIEERYELIREKVNKNTIEILVLLSEELDIEMPEISGLEVRDKLAFINNVRRIIFMTSHVEAMEDAFGLKVMR